jgi:hypothetical protein
MPKNSYFNNIHDLIKSRQEAKSSSLEREILNPIRDENNLTIQPKEVGADRELVESHNRERFANHFKYADPYTGNTRTFDEEGNYACGKCNQAQGNKCLLVDIESIDRKAGSCGDWENLCAGDPEMVLNEKSPEVASYGVAKNGEGFGCHRCPYASTAIAPDSRGRSLYCGKGDFRVFPKACCALNGAPVIGDNNYEEEDEENE